MSVFCVLWWLPGLYLLPKDKNLKTLDKSFLAVTLGVSIYSLVIYIVRLVGLPFWIGYFPFLFLTFRFFRTRTISLSRLKMKSVTATFIMIMLISAAIQALVLTRSANLTSEGMSFIELSAHDSLQHVYLINELKDHFPPRHPGYSPIEVKNYHFLIDVTLASISKYLPFSTFHLYYRILPLAVSALFSIGVFTFIRHLTKSPWLANAAVVLTIFSGNAAWVMKFFRGDEFTVSANSFMLDPVIDLLQNPMAVLVFPLMIAGSWTLLNLEKKPNLKWNFIGAILLGVMIGFKAWGGTLMLIGLGVRAIYLSVWRKRMDGWVTTFLTLGVALTIMLPVYDRQTAANPIFTPGWLLKRMVEDHDRYNTLNDYFLEQHYREKGNLPRLIQLNVKQLAIYTFGNLWIKFLGLVYFAKLIKKPSGFGVFLLTVTVFSLFLPVLFNQGRMSYDIIQFGPYALVLMSLFTIVSLPLILKRFSSITSGIIVGILLLLSFPSNIKSIQDRYRADSFLVTNQELEAFEYIKQHTDLSSTLMVYPSHRNDSSLLVAAFTGRPTYFSGKSFARITGEDYEGRAIRWKEFFNQANPGERQQTLKDGSIGYLLLTSEEEHTFNKTGLNLKTVYSNEETIIYQIQN